MKDKKNFTSSGIEAIGRASYKSKTPEQEKGYPQ